MKLSDRLRAVAGLVTMGSRLADIGTDHAYIPITLVAEKKIPSAIAMDVKNGPLQIAKEHIDRAGFGQYISVRLSDGLEKLREREADSIVIAGMGGRLAVKILSEGAAKLEGVRELILQPQSEIAFVRRYLREHGMQIETEKMVLEDGKYYPMFRVVLEEGTSECQTDNTDIFDAFGRFLLESRDLTLLSFLHHKKRQYEKVAAQLEESRGPENRKQEVAKELALIAKAFTYMETSDIR